MLRPPGPEMTPPRDERPVSEIVHQLVEDGKAYARAELAVAKAIAAAKGKAAAIPAALLGVALLFVQAAVTVLAVATFLALLPLVGPFFAGLAAFLLFAGIGGGLARVAVGKLRAGL